MLDYFVINDRKYILDTSPKYTGWRCLHAAEGGFVNPAGMPNVRRGLNAPAVEFGAALQRLSFDVMKAVNPGITSAGWANVFDSETAFTNNGHGVEGNDPKLMDGIICAGMFLPDSVRAVTANGIEYLECVPGIHAVDAAKPLPTVSAVIENGWYFVANTGQGATGAFNFPQGNGGAVAIVYALEKPVWYRKSWFTRWDSDARPDPLKYYVAK